MIRIFILGLFLISMFLLLSCTDDDKQDIIRNPINGNTSAVFNPNVVYGTMIDQDSNIYKTVQIGTQIWMAENLRTSIYNDGQQIQNITDNTEWINTLTGASCTYQNTTDPDSILLYGRLYNWYALNSGKLAPKGWHLADTNDWKTLRYYLGDTLQVGGMLKEVSFEHWMEPNTGADNITGFTAIPGGFRSNLDGSFQFLHQNGYWWCISTKTSNYAYFSILSFNDNNLVLNYNGKHCGFAVRCLKDYPRK